MRMLALAMTMGAAIRAKISAAVSLYVRTLFSERYVQTIDSQVLYFLLRL